MEISIWLIILGAIIIFNYGKSQGREKNQNIAIAPEEQELDNSLNKLNKQWKHEADTSSFINLDEIDKVLKLHDEKISKLKDNPNSVRNERQALDESLLFSQRLWQFINDIKYYPNWYENSKKRGETPWWKSKAIQPEELTIKKFSESTLKKLIDKSDKISDSDDILEYSFKIDGNKYTLFINKDSRQDTNYFGSETRESIYFYSVFVFENNKKLVYEGKLFHEIGEYTDSYDHYDLESFKPGQWTKFLLEKIFAIRAEEVQSTKEFREKMNKEMEEKNKEKFLD